MKRACPLALMAVLALCLVACSAPREEVVEDSFTLRFACESEGVYQIFYTYCVGGERRGMGGAADLDGKELSPDAPLEVPLFRASFEEGDDLSAFSIDLSPYGKDDTAARGTTAPLAFPAQWGGTYTIVLSGDEANGFTASLAA